jgi:hypothetical protein
MNGYVEAGYAVILGTLGTYSVSLIARERSARRRVGGPSGNRSAAGAPTIDHRPADESEPTGSS